MKKNLLVIVVGYLAMVLPVACKSQSKSGDRVVVRVTPLVTSDPNNGFTYQYTIRVDGMSPQSLVSFTIELGVRDHSDLSMFESNVVGDENWGGSTTMPSDKPSSFKGAEITWVPLDTLVDLSDQFSMPQSAVQPGDSLLVTVTSYGLPQISRFWAHGWYQPVTEQEYDSLVASGYSQDSVLRPWYSDSFRGTTVAPHVPHQEFNATTFLDTLASYKHQAFALGWIKEEGIVTSLDAKLEAARAQIIADRPSAKQILQSFVNELDALNVQGNHITSEAYALLKFNAQYLISKL